LLFDSDCGFCRWAVAKLLRWDRHHMLRPIAIQDAEADRWLGGMDDKERMESWHLATPDGELYSAGEAVAPLMRLLPAGTPVAALAASFPGTTERLYRWVARHRDQLGGALGTEACAVDPSAHPGNPPR